MAEKEECEFETWCDMMFGVEDYTCVDTQNCTWLKGFQKILNSMREDLAEKIMSSLYANIRVTSDPFIVTKRCIGIIQNYGLKVK